MKRVLYKPVKAASLIFALSFFPAVAAHAAVNPQIQTRVTTSMQELQTYNTTHSFPALKTAIETLFNAVDTRSVSPSDYVTFRRTVMQGWANILKAIEQSYDPTYDPNNPADRPNLCVLPHNGSVTCNISPDQIQDPKERAKYAAALQANALKLQQSYHFHDVSVLDLLAMGALQMHLKGFAAAGAPSDYAALDGIFRQAGISSSRMVKIDAMLAAPAPKTNP